MRRGDIDKLARNQAGLITREQVRATGGSDSFIARCVKEASLERVLPGVFRLRSSPRTHSQRLMAAYLWAGPTAALSFITAAYILGLQEREPSSIEITQPWPRRSPSKEIILHTSALGPGETIRRSGMRVTSPSRTLFDMSSRLRRCTIESMTEKALREGLTSRAKLEKTLAARPGCPGAVTMRRVLNDLCQTLTDSELEVLVAQLVRSQKLPEPERQVPFEVDGHAYRIDFAYPQKRLCIECDGFAFHSDREAFDRDRDKTNMLTSQDWSLLRFTWRDLKYRPAYVAKLIRDHLSKP